VAVTAILWFKSHGGLLRDSSVAIGMGASPKTGFSSTGGEQ
jgi:hypothetical protein